MSTSLKHTRTGKDVVGGTSNMFLDQLTSSPVDLFSAPTSLTRFLTYVAPFVRVFSYFFALVTWSTGNPSESCLLVTAWWTLCLFPRELCVYGLHVILLTWIGLQWVESGKRERLGVPEGSNARATSQADLNKTMLEIQKISEKLSDFHAIVDSFDRQTDWSNPAQTRIIVLALCYSYPTWIVFNYFVSLRWTFIIVGTAAFVWNSPWARIVRYVMMQSPVFRGFVEFAAGFVLAGKWQPKKGFSVTALVRKAKEQQQKMSKRAKKEGSKTSADLVFKFILYENQRWWLGLDWTANLFPNERAPWTDEYNEPIGSKDAFQLPAPSTTHHPSSDKPNLLVCKTMEWRWSDPDWYVVKDANCDRDGWEYTDNRWKHRSSKGGLGKYTRRRKWIRAARLLETIERVERPNPSGDDHADPNPVPHTPQPQQVALHTIDEQMSPSMATSPVRKKSAAPSISTTVPLISTTAPLRSPDGRPLNKPLRTISRGLDGRFDLSRTEDSPTLGND